MSDSSARGDAPDPNRVLRTWLWFRTAIDARSPVEKDFFRLPVDAVATLQTKMMRFAHGESRRDDVDHLGDGILEIRGRAGSAQYRVLFFVWGPHLVALSAFHKNQRSTPKQDLDTARARRSRWRAVFGDERST